MVKFINSLLVVMLVLLLVRAVRGNGGFAEVKQLRATITQQQQEILASKKNNDALLAELEYLKTEPLAIEELVRVELGMIKQGESYYQVIEPIE